MPPTAPPSRIAYLTGQYPLVSLTFIQREIEGLRAQGLDVITCSVRETPANQHPGPAEKEAAAATFYILKAARNPRHLLAAQLSALRNPMRYFRTLSLALRTGAPGLRARLYQLFFFAEATILARHLQAQKVTHLHNHFVTGSATVAMLASELTGIPYSFMLHGPADLFEPYRWRLDEKTARAEFVTTISYFARSQLMFFSDPADWDKIRIVHCGVHPDRYDRPAPAREDDEIRLVFVGRLAPVKGLRVLLEALGPLMAEIPQLRLTLVGDGPDRAVLEQAAAPLGDRVRFTGYLSQAEVAETLQSSDIFVLPSFAEGVPVALMEAMASRKPVIATQVGGVSELVESETNGFVVPPGHVDRLRAAIRTLAQDGALRARMGEAGRATVCAEFDIAKETAWLANLMSGDAPPATPRPDR